MTSLLWIALPYGAFISFILGHVWRYRRDGFRSYTSDPEVDREQRFGTTAFRYGVCLIVIARVSNMLAAQPHAHPAGAIHIVITIVLLAGGTAAVIGAVLLFLPDLIAGPAHPLITPLDRITFPALAAALLSGVLIDFDPASTREYRTGETLFAWFRSLFTISPHPEAMQHAPFIHQGRGLILLLIIGIWPYTRLAGIFAGPVVRLALRVLPRRAGGLGSASAGA
ncbi:respiratory nitrate reductase subunit gamma [Nocardia sp. NPDC005998]|uniref:respiratory nitrate reductase subunit gamma n=1 Tax=Nocardia sp. NPDC005998 TaxID=3156894 RepID=UPI0033AC53A4